jgi:hypothetical protein
MEVKNKEALKQEIQDRVDVYVKEFPIYFAGSIIINLMLFFILLACAVYTVISIDLSLISGRPVGVEGIYYGFGGMILIMPVIKYTWHNLRRCFRGLKLMSKGKYDFEIEDYELDHAAEFIEQLPMKKEELEKMKVELSFGKIIDILEVIGIISCRRGIYDVKIVFDCEVDELMREKVITNLDKKIENSQYEIPEPKEKHSGYWEPKSDENSILDEKFYN